MNKTYVDSFFFLARSVQRKNNKQETLMYKKILNKHRVTCVQIAILLRYFNYDDSNAFCGLKH